MLFRNFLLALGAAFVLAGLALGIFWLRQIGSPEVASSGPGTAQTPNGQSVLAATRSLASGTLLRPTDIGWRDIKGGELRPGNLLRGQISETELLGTITRRDFADGEALIASELVMPGDRRFLAAVLTPGSRAASISVDAPQSASGLVLPGDRVDVILTQNLGDGAGDPKRKSVGETVLRNLRVIAVGPSLGPQAKPATPETAAPTPEGNVPKTVTLELGERQAETLFVAAQLGALQLSVRPLEGTSQASVDRRNGAPTWASDVSPALKELKVTVQPPEPSGSTIESSIRRPPARPIPPVSAISPQAMQ
jgi:pilus assembly protein CpaB